MLRLILFLLAIALLTVGLGWLADRPGNLVVDWQGYQIETSVFLAVVLSMLAVGAAVVLWSIARGLIAGPALLASGLRRRREKHGLQAIANGLIAVGSGDRQLAERATMHARRALPNEPLTDFLRAQEAQLAGDRSTARRIYEAMTHSPETELLGLRGLYLEAEREKEWVAARQFAERAMKLNPRIAWPVEALFVLQCRQGDLAGALDTLQVARRNEHVERKLSDRRRAVLLTGLAQGLEDRDAEKAIAQALEAHELQPDLVAPAEIAGRLLAQRGNLSKAAGVLTRTYKRNPHPDLALAYAYARPGDSPRDRLKRVRELASAAPTHRESAIAVATAAIDAHEWEEARRALEPLAADLSARVCVLMARIEAGERGDTGRMREWLARALSAPRDPVWTADGQIAERWAAVSPVTGRLDAYEWTVPAGSIDATGGTLLLEQIRTLAMQRPIPDPEAEVIEVPRIPPRKAPLAEIEEAEAAAAEAPAVVTAAVHEPATSERTPARRESNGPLPFDPTHAPDDPGPGFAEPSDEADPRRQAAAGQAAKAAAS